MKYHPIIFDTESVRAILNGHKTQTRRVGKRYASWQPGDKLWVKETWIAIPDPDPELGGLQVKYKATDSFDASMHGGWHSPLFMPRWASRIKLEIVNLREEHLRSMNEADFFAEGGFWAEKEPGSPAWHIGGYSSTATDNTWQAAFSAYWDSINAKHGYGWDTNPKVWRIEFRRIKP